MISSGERRRVRPSLKSLVLSAFVFPLALLVAERYFQLDLYIPVIAVLVVAASVTAFRYRGLSTKLPEPYGHGRISSIDAKSTARAGILIILGGVVCLFFLFGSVYILPPVAFFALVFGLAGGLPLEEIVFFTVVARLESASEMRIFTVTEETEKDGQTVLLKSVEMIPTHPD